VDKAVTNECKKLPFQLLTSLGSVSTPNQAYLLNLTSSSPAQFFTDSNCNTAPVTKVTYPANATELNVWFKNSSVGPQTITIADAGSQLTSASGTLTVLGPPSKLVWYDPYGYWCSGGYNRISIRDANNNPTYFTSDHSFKIKTDKIGSGFYLASNWQYIMETTLTISAGMSESSDVYASTIFYATATDLQGSLTPAQATVDYYDCGGD
jgi:hypothetical protein